MEIADEFEGVDGDGETGNVDGHLQMLGRMRSPRARAHSGEVPWPAIRSMMW